MTGFTDEMFYLCTTAFDVESQVVTLYKLASCLFHQSYHSILRRSNRERKGGGRRARLSPLVLLLDGALVGELETVQRAVQEVCVCVCVCVCV